RPAAVAPVGQPLPRAEAASLSEGIGFFSSRRRHTRLVSDWSSDVCSSDLVGGEFRNVPEEIERARVGEGIGVRDRAAVDYVAHGDLADLAADGARNLSHLHD